MVVGGGSLALQWMMSFVQRCDFPTTVSGLTLACGLH